MEEENHQSDRYHDELVATEALEIARTMLPGPQRSQALKDAGLLRRAVDARGIVFARRGRPPK